MGFQTRTELMFAASAGGHLDLLLALSADVVGDRDAVWVTSDTARGRALRGRHADVELLTDFGRDGRAALRNVRGAARIIRRRRPATVVTSGAGLTVPLVVLARLSGARVLYVETMARVVSPSKTARILSRLADHVIVQWPELASQLPRAIVCRPVLLEGVPEGERAGGEGTFVALGTHAQGFERLLGIVERAAADGVLPAPVFAQAGPSRRDSAHVEMVDFVSAEELARRMASARVVVCHAGAGFISTALSSGHTPIVIPRRAALSEHVDDHQHQLAQKLEDFDAVVKVETDIRPEDVARALAPLTLPADLHDGVSVAEVLAGKIIAGETARTT